MLTTVLHDLCWSDPSCPEGNKCPSKNPVMSLLQRDYSRLPSLVAFDMENSNVIFSVSVFLGCVYGIKLQI